MAQSECKLKDIRESEGLSVPKLSSFSDVSVRTISDIEKGKRVGSKVVRNKIVKGLNKNPEKSKSWKYKDIWKI